MSKVSNFLLNSGSKGLSLRSLQNLSPASCQSHEVLGIGDTAMNWSKPLLK